MCSVSVIVPTCNDELTIRQTLESAERSANFLTRQPAYQSCRVEVIIVDDGSQDSTLGILLDFARGKGIFRIYHRSNASSPGSARNAGVSLSQGDYLFFLDADDLFLEPHLFECCRALENSSVDFVKTGVALSDTVHPAWISRIVNTLPINLAVRRKCHDFIGGFPDIHLFRRFGDSFSPWVDVYRLIEDVYYNDLLAKLFKRHNHLPDTVKYCRWPGNSFDRQYEKFQHPPGTGPSEERNPEFDFRVRLSKLITEYEVERLRKELASKVSSNRT